MAERVISYPLQFLERPCDRTFLMLLEERGLSEAESNLLLYRIWADYATGGSNRRPMTEREVAVMERFVGWRGETGTLVPVALESGFLREADGMLECVDFYPVNSRWSADGKSFQRKGAHTRVLMKHAAEADRSAGEQIEIWERTKASTDLTGPEARAALVFIHQVCRALGMRVPDDGTLRSGLLRQAHHCMAGSNDGVVRNTLLWLLGMRADPRIPNRLDAVLREWAELEAMAKQEMV